VTALILLRRLTRGVLRLGVLGAVVATLLPMTWKILPSATALAPMAPQFAGIAAALALVALIVGLRVWAVLALAAVVGNLVLIWPDISPFRGPLPPTEAQSTLRVMTFNVWFKNADIDGTLNYMAAGGADVIGLVEVTPGFKEHLARLKAIYPYSIDCVDANPECQTVLLSKYPLKNAYAGPIEGSFPYIAIAEVEKPGAAITVGVTHLSWPFAPRQRTALVATMLDQPAPSLPDVPSLEQSVQAATLADFLSSRPRDLILMGDFNSASWSPVHKSFRDATGLAEYPGLLLTWPAWTWPVLRLPIDHILARGRARVVGAMTGRASGSDHLPLLANVVLQ
jgi:endonuclease/exonuclease/phosphatase (EEP) superfamily protein YafD